VAGECRRAGVGTKIRGGRRWLCGCAASRAHQGIAGARLDVGKPAAPPAAVVEAGQQRWWTGPRGIGHRRRGGSSGGGGGGLQRAAVAAHARVPARRVHGTGSVAAVVCTSWGGRRRGRSHSAHRPQILPPRRLPVRAPVLHGCVHASHTVLGRSAARCVVPLHPICAPAPRMRAGSDYFNRSLRHWVHQVGGGGEKSHEASGPHLHGASSPRCMRAVCCAAHHPLVACASCAAQRFIPSLHVRNVLRSASSPRCMHAVCCAALHPLVACAQCARRHHPLVACGPCARRLHPTPPMPPPPRSAVGA
jgi:hypothetical protein